MKQIELEAGWSLPKASRTVWTAAVISSGRSGSNGCAWARTPSFSFPGSIFVCEWAAKLGVTQFYDKTRAWKSEKVVSRYLDSWSWRRLCGKLKLCQGAASPSICAHLNKARVSLITHYWKGALFCLTARGSFSINYRLSWRLTLRSRLCFWTRKHLFAPLCFLPIIVSKLFLG